MTYIPERNNRAAVVIISVLFAVAAGCFVATGFLTPKAVYQICLIVCLTLGIQLTQRYLLTSYEYMLNDENELAEHNDIVVIKKQGKKSTVLCNLSLNYAVLVSRDASVKELESKYGPIGVRFSFCPDLFPKKPYGLLIGFDGKKAWLKLQCDEKFAGEISRRIGLFKEEF
ncbi:MAG: hypothetical protein PUE85_08575 [Firmicutes bacterium]|nr:hypothetical protein [Bacillota bacterium]